MPQKKTPLPNTTISENPLSQKVYDILNNHAPATLRLIDIAKLLHLPLIPLNMSYFVLR